MAPLPDYIQNATRFDVGLVAECDLMQRRARRKPSSSGCIDASNQLLADCFRPSLCRSEDVRLRLLTN